MRKHNLHLVAEVLKSTDSSTLSILSGFQRSLSDKEIKTLGHICFLIEDASRNDKVKHHTRIPSGFYQVEKRQYGRFFESYKRRFGHRFVPELKDVPEFTNILIHIGNKITETSGCLLPNMGCKQVGEDWQGLQSTAAYLQLYSLIDQAENTTLMLYRDGKKIF